MEANLLGQLVSTGPAQLLIASIWQGLLLTAFAWACLEVASRLRFTLRASTRFTLWMIVFLLVALLPCFAVVRGLFGPPSSSVILPPQADFSLHLPATWAFVIEGMWAIASLFSLARLLAGGKEMWTLLRNSTLVPSSALSAELQLIVMRAGTRPVEIRLSDTVDAPSVIGFFRPAVVVPRSLWTELPPGDLRQIILHEMAHLDRGDDWINLLQKLLRALFPLNPALAWAERRLCQEREQACDDAVLAAAGNARAYATCLTKLAETRLVKRAAALAPGLWKRHSDLGARVENILHPRRTVDSLFSRGFAGACLVVALAGGLVMQRCPGLISFTSRVPLTAAMATPPSTSSTHPLGQATYQNAVFHSTANDGRDLPGKPLTVPAKSHVRPRPAYAAPRIAYLQLRSSDDGLTLILFTVELPQIPTGLHREDRPEPAPVILPDNWIVFQI